jgi:hypothetical protein
MNTLSLMRANQTNSSRHTLPHFSDHVELVSGDNGNYQITILHRAEAQHLYETKRAMIPEGYKRSRNIAKLFVIDHHPKQEHSRYCNSSKTTYTQHFTITPGSQSPRFALGRSIMGILIQHKPISNGLVDLYAVKQVG